MDNETLKIFEEQTKKLPSGVIEFLSSANWDNELNEIGSLYSLSPEELSGFKREATLILAGIVHPDAFSDSLEQEVGLRGAVLDAVVTATEKRVFAQIRPLLVSFFEEEAAKNAKQEITEEQLPVKEELTTPPSPEPTQTRTWEKGPDIAPDNLPTAEEPESFLPPLQQKPTVPPTPEEPPHPFEEKMKRVFTAGQQSVGDLALETPPPQGALTQPARNYHADPYREPIE